MKNVRTKCNIFGEGLIRGKRTKFASQIVRNALKCPLQYVNFQKFSGGACPWTTYNHFRFPICFKFNFATKNTFKKCQNLVLKGSEYTPLTWIHFLKRTYLRSFSGLPSLHSVDIQPNSKLHPPSKFSGSAPEA